MTFAFHYPGSLPIFLLGAYTLLLLAALVHSRRILLQLTERSHRHRLLVMLLPLLAATSATIGWMEPRVQFSTRPKRFVALLDFSPSARMSPWRFPAWVQGLAVNMLPADSTLTLVAYSNESLRELAADLPVNDKLAWPKEWQLTPGAEAFATVSDEVRDGGLQRALEWRLPDESQAATPLSPRWVLTDGAFDEIPSAAQPGNAKFPIFWSLHPSAPVPADVAIGSIRKDGQTVWLEARASGECTAEITLTRNHQPLATQTLQFERPPRNARFRDPSFRPDEPRTNAMFSRWISVRDPEATPLDATQTVYEARIRRTPTLDPWPENDTATLTLGRSPATALILTSDAAPHSPLLAALVVPGNSESIHMKPFAGDADAFFSRIHSGDPTNSVRMLIIDAAHLETLPPTLLNAVETAARLEGLPLLFIGQPQAAEAEAPLLKLSPLTFDSPQRPGLELTCLLDASASMNEPAQAGERESKFQLALHALDRMRGSLRPTDALHVIAFNNEATLLQSGNLSTAAGQIIPTGTTRFDAALPATEQLLTQHKVATHELVLLTDGEIPALSTDRWSSLLKSTHTAFTIIAPPAPHSPLADLAAATHATWLSSSDATSWSQHLRESLDNALFAPPQRTPITWRSTLPGWEGKTGQSDLWFEAWPKAEAVTVAESHVSPSQTLAAIAMRGLAPVAAIAVEDASSDSQQLVAQLLNELLRRAGNSKRAAAFQITCDRIPDAPNDWLLRIDASQTSPESIGPSPRLTVRLINDHPDAPAINIPVPLVAPALYQICIHGSPAAILCLATATEAEPSLIATLHRRSDASAESAAGSHSSGWIEEGQQQGGHAEFATMEYPATFQPPVKILQQLFPDPVTGADAPAIGTSDTNHRWTPLIQGPPLELETFFLLLAGMVALGAIAMRR